MRVFKWWGTVVVGVVAAIGACGDDATGANDDAAAPDSDAAVVDDSGMRDAAMHDGGGEPMSDSSAPTEDAGMDASMTDMDSSLDSGPEPDGAADDAGDDGAVDAGADAEPAPVYDPVVAAAASAAIATARAADGAALDIVITDALVTYVLGAVSDEPAGFFIQGEPTGPAVFIAVDASTLTPAPEVGDTVTFTVTQVATVASMKHVLAISGFSVTGSGYDVGALVQDASSATDLVSNVGDYESELLQVSGTLSTATVFAGPGHVAARLETTGVTANANLELRTPTELADALDLVQGCTIETQNTPLWRYNAIAEVSAWTEDDIIVQSCPAPQIVQAFAPSATSVVVRLDRHVDPASVLASGSQFVLDSGLTVSAATVSGKDVTLTTSMQTVSFDYTVAVAASVTDTLGASVPMGARSAAFTGHTQQAVVRINEINAHVNNGCDLIELRVMGSGSMDGFTLRERGFVVAEVSGLDVLPNDILVVHFNSGNASCNPGTSLSETTSKSQFPLAMYGANYDGAYDIYTGDSGLTDTNNVFVLRNAYDQIVDAVLASADATGMAASASETEAAIVAAAGEWTTQAGQVPAGGFIDDDFSANAALDLDATGTAASGTSMQRIDDMDRNHRGDWDNTGTVANTWGAKNADQSDF